MDRDLIVILKELEEKVAQTRALAARRLERERNAAVESLKDLDRALERAEKAEAELAAIKEERLALAKECVEAWESAVEWSGYASDYFREKHGVYKDQYRLDNARDRLVMLPQAAIKAAQPEYMCPNCVSPWKCNGPHIPEHTIKAAQEDA